MTCTPEMVSQNPHLIEVRPASELTPAHYLAAVKTLGLMLRRIPVDKRSTEVCRAAVQENYTALEWVTLPSDAFGDPASGQLRDWVAVLKACRLIDASSVTTALVPLLERFPLGEDYTEVWKQAISSDRVYLDLLLEFTDELMRVGTRASPSSLTEITRFRHRVNQQVEWALKSELDAERSRHRDTADTDPAFDGGMTL